jgi:hypothetical protein
MISCTTARAAASVSHATAKALTPIRLSAEGRRLGAIAVPWGGTAHPVWFRNDPRVANCKAMGGVLSRPVMENVVATTQMVKEKIKPLPLDQQEQELGKIAAAAA